jgi:SRSO17 transposase
MPEEWAQDQQRREKTAVPETVGTRTKSELAKEMLRRALEAGVEIGFEEPKGDMGLSPYEVRSWHGW